MPQSRPDFSYLVGRNLERLAVENLFGGLPQAGGALAWAGDRGVGRTAVLRAAQALAGHAGYRLASVGCVALASRPGGLRDSLQGQLATRTVDSPAGSVTRSSADSLTSARPGRDLRHRLVQVLSECSTHSRPLVLCLDDADMLNADDAAAVAFAARRLGSLPVVILMTTGPASRPFLERYGIPIRSLRPLTSEESGQLLAAHHPRLDPQVAHRVIESAAGSPLSLIELPAALTRAQRRGLEPLSALLPLTDRLREAYGEPFHGLSRPARDALTLAAVGGAQGLLSLVGPTVAVVDSAALNELELAGIFAVQNDLNRIGFRHPLIRHAWLDCIDDVELTRARDLLAAAFPGDPDQQVWQLAEVWDQPDRYLGDQLELVATTEAERGNPDRAVAALVRAAQLSPELTVRSRRLLEAAHLRATITGEIDTAALEVVEASRADPSAALSPRAAATNGQVMMIAGAPLKDVYGVLVRALNSEAAAPDRDEAATLDALRLLFYVCLLSAQPELWSTFNHLMARHHVDIESVVGLLGNIFPDITRTSKQTLTRLDAAVARLTDTVDPGEVVGVSIAAYQLDRLAGCRAPLSRVVDEAHRGGLAGIGPEAILRLAFDDCHTGQLPRAARLAATGVEMATALGRSEHMWAFELCLALIAALRGDQREVETLTGQMSSWAAPRGALLVEHHCDHVRGLAALGRGDYELAYAHATAINPPGTLAGHTNVTYAACLDLVEAATHIHRGQEAAAHAAAMAESGMARLSPRLALRVAAALAMTAPDRSAPELFEEALAIPHVERWPFERARVQLAYGSRLRRMHSKATAQPHLNASHEIFRRLGTRGWAHRAAQEMRAGGMPLAAGLHPLHTSLTGRDLEIATLAAAGLSNHDIGARLFLSPRTVGGRLYRIFPKLGISSRAGLRDALGRPSAAPSEG